jgi:hypothetical protein
MDEAGIDLQVISENNPATQNLDADRTLIFGANARKLLKL